MRYHGGRNEKEGAMKVVISGYGKMGRMVEKILSGRGIECAGKSDDIQGFDKAIAKDCVCIDFTVPAAFKANYRFLAENFKAVVVGSIQFLCRGKCPFCCGGLPFIDARQGRRLQPVYT